MSDDTNGEEGMDRKKFLKGVVALSVMAARGEDAIGGGGNDG